VYTPLATPPTKKWKVQKRSRAERTVEKAMESFMTYQHEAEERYQRNEERWQKEIEVEEKRRKEDQEHEMRMMGQMFQGSYHRQYEFDYLPSQHDNYD
jgi:hypothetical protein